MATEVIRPNSDVNTVWADYDYAKVDDAVLDGTAGSGDVAFSDGDNLEQIWGLEIPSTLDTITSASVYVYGFNETESSVDVRVKIGGVWTSSDTVGIGNSSLAWGNSIDFTGSWMASDFTAAEVGVFHGSLGGKDECHVDVCYVNLTGTIASGSTYDEDATGGGVVSGLGDIYAVYNLDATGGATGGGLALAPNIYDDDATGGVVVSGASTISVESSIIIGSGGVTVGGETLVGPIVYDVIRPNGNVNTQWSVFTFENVNDVVLNPTTGDGTTAQATFVDKGREQQWDYESLTTAGSPTSVEVIVSSKYTGTGTPTDISLRAYIGGTWESAQSITPGDGVYSYDSVTFTGSWSITDFDDFRTGMRITPISSGEIYDVDVIYAKVLGETLTVYDEVMSGGVVVIGYSTGVYADPEGGAECGGTATISQIHETTVEGGASGGGFIRSGFTPAECVNNILCDTFWDSQDGNVLSLHEAGLGATYTVSGGTWTISDENVTTSATAFTTAVTEAAANLTLTVDITFDATNPGTAGVVFRYFSSANHWRVDVDPTSNSLEIIEVTGGVETQRAFGLITLTLGTTYTLNLFAHGAEINATIGGVEVGISDAATFLSETLAGLHMNGGGSTSTTYFDNLNGVVPTYNINALGGCVVSGSGSLLVIYDSDASGGVVASGQAITSSPFDAETKGGVAVGGSALLFVEGDATLTGTATVDATGEPTIAGTATLTGVATMDAAATIQIKADATLTGTATIVADGAILKSGSATLTGTAAIDADGAVTYVSDATLTATATMDASGRTSQGFPISWVGVATITAQGTQTHNQTITAAGVEAGGVADLFVIYNHEATGGAVAGGTATQQSDNMPELTLTGEATIDATGTNIIYGAGGAVVGGEATNTGIWHNNATLTGVATLDGDDATVVKNGEATLTGVATMDASGRTSEGFPVSMVGVATLNATATVSRAADAVLTGVATMNPVGVYTAGGTSTLTGVATMVLGFSNIRTGTTTLTGVASMDATASPLFGATATLTGVATMDADGVSTSDGEATMVGVATLTADAVISAVGSSTMTGVATMRAKLSGIPAGLIPSLTNYLANQPTITELVGTRVYPVRLPQTATFPCVMIRRISVNHMRDLDNPGGVATTRVQFDIMSRNWNDVKLISEALRKVLEGYSDMMGTVDIFSSVLEGVNDPYNASQIADEVGYHQRGMDFMITHTEKVLV